MKVSVVVPVFNPGPYVDPCIDSLLGQSLPVTDYEVIFVDDGSTDGTGQRLDELAAAQPNVQCLHIPNSGWPGRPRNVGLDAATGDFVYFVDNDDWLGVEALERLTAAAERAQADIVIGKVVGHGGKVVTRELFRQSADGLTFPDTPLLLSLMSPHKLFRRDLLVREGIRFPEGRRRLEDHVFVLRAYFAARAISVLADYECYHWVGRPDDTNASRTGTDWAGYFHNLAEVLDVVDAHVPPGPQRDRLYRHWVRFKVLRRMGGSFLLGLDPAERQQLYDAAHELARTRFTEGMLAGLNTNIRIRGRLLAAGQLSALVELARLDDIRAVCEVTEAHRVERGVRVDVRVGLVDAEDQPLAVDCADGRFRWALPESIVDGDATAADTDITREARATRLDVLVRERDSRVEFVHACNDVVARYDAELGTLRVAGTAQLDPNRLAAGGSLPDGIWDVYVRVILGGWDRTARLPAPPQLPAEVFDDSGPAVFYRTTAENLSLRVGGSTATLAGRVARRLRRTTRPASGS